MVIMLQYMLSQVTMLYPLKLQCVNYISVKLKEKIKKHMNGF